MTKEEQILDYLHKRVFDPVLTSPAASEKLKQGVRLTITRMKRLDAEKMLQYFWSAVSGTDRSIDFAAQMRSEGFTRFEECVDEFGTRFTDDWLRS
jgi:hypothetical protein